MPESQDPIIISEDQWWGRFQPTNSDEGPKGTVPSGTPANLVWYIANAEEGLDEVVISGYPPAGVVVLGYWICLVPVPDDERYCFTIDCSQNYVVVAGNSTNGVKDVIGPFATVWKARTFVSRNGGDDRYAEWMLLPLIDPDVIRLREETTWRRFRSSSFRSSKNSAGPATK